MVKDPKVRKGYFKTSDGAYLYYEDTGVGDPIVFAPGHMCTTKFYAKNVDALKQTHRVVCFDSRGFGSSSKPLHGNCVDRHADDIKELLDHLDLDRAALVAWSLSGSIAVTYAAKYKGHRLKALGLLDCSLFPFSPEPWNTYNSRDYNMDDWNEKYIPWHTDIDRYVENFVSRLRDDLTPEEVDMVRTEILKTPPWIGFALHSDWCHTDAASLLGDVPVPVVIFSGVSKGHGFEMGRHYKTQVKTYCELHEFAKGGHVLFMADPERFNKILTDFLTAIGSGNP